MKALFALALILISPAFAQSPTIQTSFTMGAPHNNYLPVLTQNGNATADEWWIDYVYDCDITTDVCPYGVTAGESVQIVLPESPTHPGYELGVNCLGTVTSPPIPSMSHVPLPSMTLTSQLSCTDSSFSQDKWTGTVNYVYQFVLKRTLRGAAYYPIVVSGYGSLTYP